MVPHQDSVHSGSPAQLLRLCVSGCCRMSCEWILQGLSFCDRPPLWSITSVGGAVTRVPHPCRRAAQLAGVHAPDAVGHAVASLHRLHFSWVSLRLGVGVPRDPRARVHRAVGPSVRPPLFRLPSEMPVQVAVCVCLLLSWLPLDVPLWHSAWGWAVLWLRDSHSGLSGSEESGCRICVSELACARPAPLRRELAPRLRAGG